MGTAVDLNVASLALGFTVGFGFLVVWEAIKQTQRNCNPLRSVYIRMIWGEIFANVCIGIMAYLRLSGVVESTIPVLLVFLIAWVFETQLLMQIIINRITILADNRDTMTKIKWGTAGFITCINILVICIWLPSQTTPPVSQGFVIANKYWDPMSKILIMLVDGTLNCYFISTVRKSLVNDRGLTKYEPLVSFNTKLMAVSLLTDVIIIALLFLDFGVLFLQFHPVAYMVKLNIEMTMANLIAKLARRPFLNQDLPRLSLSDDTEIVQSKHDREDSQQLQPWAQPHAPPYAQEPGAIRSDSDTDLNRVESHRDSRGNHKRTDVRVNIRRDSSDITNNSHHYHIDSGSNERRASDTAVDDEMPLRQNASHLETRSSSGTLTAVESGDQRREDAIVATKDRS